MAPSHVVPLRGGPVRKIGGPGGIAASRRRWAG